MNRQPDGNYLLDVSASKDAFAQQMYAPELVEEKAEAGGCQHTLHDRLHGGTDNDDFRDGRVLHCCGAAVLHLRHGHGGQVGAEVGRG